MTKEDLTRLDNYGHKKLEELNVIQLFDYSTLLGMRHQEVNERIRELLKGGE